MNSLLPTRCCLQTFDNQSNGHCFACNQLWKDTNHVLHCQTEDHCTTRTVAFQTFCLHLQKQHTPNIMATLICDSMHSWINHTWISPPDLNPPAEPIMHALHQAFQAQRLIGWDQFFRGHIALKWKDAITLYYHERHPGPLSPLITGCALPSKPSGPSRSLYGGIATQNTMANTAPYHMSDDD